MHGVEPKSLGVAGLDLETENHYYSFLEWTKELQELEGMVNEEVEENLGTARAKMKRAYNIGKCEYTAKAGDLVLVRNHSRRSGLDQCFKGPFIVLKRIGPNVMIRQEKGGGKTVEKWLHLNR